MIFLDIMNNVVKNEWGKINILGEFEKKFYVPSNTFGNNLKFVKLNYEDWMSVVQKGIIQFGTTSIPTLIFFCIYILAF